jgi:phage-related protein
MSNLTLDPEKPLVWLHGEVKTPPFSREARLEAGYLLGQLQRGGLLSMPQSRPMPSIGARCHELRVVDGDHNWRIVYRLDIDAVLILVVFAKKTQSTPKDVIANCQRRIKLYDKAAGGRL